MKCKISEYWPSGRAYLGHMHVCVWPKYGPHTHARPKYTRPAQKANIHWFYISSEQTVKVELAEQNHSCS